MGLNPAESSEAGKSKLKGNTQGKCPGADSDFPKEAVPGADSGGMCRERLQREVLLNH